jgi:hypothetical protein
LGPNNAVSHIRRMFGLGLGLTLGLLSLQSLCQCAGLGRIGPFPAGGKDVQAGLGGQVLYRRPEVEAVLAHDETDGIAVRVTTETMEVS